MEHWDDDGDERGARWRPAESRAGTFGACAAERLHARSRLRDLRGRKTGCGLRGIATGRL